VVGPIILPIALGIAGWVAERWAGLVVGVAVGLLITAAVVVGAATWARQIGSLLEPEDALAHAPRPPGFAALCDWVYRRTL
jgi:hypothetical protein